MAVGNSGRIVIEIDKELKKELYKQLLNDNLTLKEWFIRMADSFVQESTQPQLKLLPANKSEE